MGFLAGGAAAPGAVPPLQSLLGTAALPARDLVLLLPYPLIVWGADQLRRYLTRRRSSSGIGRERIVEVTG